MTAKSSSQHHSKRTLAIYGLQDSPLASCIKLFVITMLSYIKLASFNKLQYLKVMQKYFN